MVEEEAPPAAPPPSGEDASVHGQAGIGWQTLTEDGGVKLRTVKEGTGGFPELHSICLVHYQARHTEDGIIFADTRTEKDGSPVTVVAGRDCIEKEAGLHAAVLHMRVGQTALVAITPKYGFGEKGSFSFPSVKPNAHIQYEIELIGVTAPQEKERKNMFFEERLEAATRMRTRGKELFAERDVNGALAQNTIALEFVDDELLFQLQGFHLQKAQAVRAPLHLNISACHLLLGNWQAAADAATDALAVTEPGNKYQFAKALFRRAKARKELQQTDQALNDLEQALKRCPDDKLIAQGLAKVRRQQREEQKAVDNLFRNKIPAPQVSPDAGGPSNTQFNAYAASAEAIATSPRLTTGETWFFSLGQSILDFLLHVLRALGLLRKVPAAQAARST